MKPDTPQKIVGDVVSASQARMLMASEYDDPSDANEAIGEAPARIQALIDLAKGQHDSLTAKAGLMEATLRENMDNCGCSEDNGPCANCERTEAVLAKVAEQTKPAESAYWKAVRTGVYPELWPPITMTRDELEHFRSTCRKAPDA